MFVWYNDYIHPIHATTTKLSVWCLWTTLNISSIDVELFSIPKAKTGMKEKRHIYSN